MGQIVHKPFKVDLAQFEPWGRGWVTDWRKVWGKQRWSDKLKQSVGHLLGHSLHQSPNLSLMGQIVQKQLKVDFAQFDPWGRGWVRDWSKVWYKQILTFNWTHEGKVEWLTEAKSGWTEVEWPTDAKCLATSVHPTLCLSQSLNHSLMGHIVPNEPWVVFAQFNPGGRGRVTDWSKVWG